MRPGAAGPVLSEKLRGLVILGAAAPAVAFAGADSVVSTGAVTCCIRKVVSNSEVRPVS